MYSSRLFLSLSVRIDQKVMYKKQSIRFLANLEDVYTV